MGDGIQRKPGVYLVVILPLLVVGNLFLAIGLVVAYSRIRGVPPSAVPNANALLITLPALLLWLPVSGLLSNVVIYCMPPLRRVAEAYVARTGRPGFAESQKVLLWAAGGLALVCLPLIALGFVI